MVAAAPVRHDSIELIYIDANVGNSSGGHVAIKSGETVYHYQNETAYARLARENWKRFRFIYNDLDNRNIHIARIAVSTSDLERLRDRLSLLFVVQSRHVDYLNALRRDEEWLDALRYGKPVEVVGIGFFRRQARGTSALDVIRLQIDKTHGRPFLTQARMQLQQKLHQLAYQPSPLPIKNLSTDRYPSYPPTFSERAQDLYTRWFALSVLEEGWPLREDALLDTDQLASTPSDDPRYARQRHWLMQYSAQLQEAILQMVERPYSGVGSALLLALARYEALSLSIGTGRFFLLDVLPKPSVPPLESTEDHAPGSVGRLLEQLKKTIPSLRQAVFALPEPDESAYHRLEVAASELREAERALRAGRSIHLSQPDGPPEGRGQAIVPLRAISSPQSSQAIRMAETQTEAFESMLESAYHYQLVTHNCVTELSTAIASSFHPADETAALGGHIDPAADQSFIPFRFFELVRQRYRVQQIQVLPSFRNRKLTELSQQGQDWAKVIRESNTLTSTLYKPVKDDTAFLFFTEEQMALRPVLGIINLGYGLGAAATGLFTIPFDEGQLMLEGARGMLFSLPEVTLWNIRKGSFTVLAPDE